CCERGEQLGTPRPSAGCQFGFAHLQVSCSSFAHVVAPFGLIELHLLLGVCQHGQVGQGPLFAKVGWHRDAPLCAAHTVHLQLAPCHALWHAGLAPLGSHRTNVRLFLSCMGRKRLFRAPFIFPVPSCQAAAAAALVLLFSLLFLSLPRFLSSLHQTVLPLSRAEAK
uniref:Uncharacterized protein n=1 Tax=Cyprinus carpio carpio TaxID=630221 RepID=A0A8C1HJI9_CYPCA